jgi:hypothetical protein
MRLKWILIVGCVLAMAVPALAQDSTRHNVRENSDTLFWLSK